MGLHNFVIFLNIFQNLVFYQKKICHHSSSRKSCLKLFLGQREEFQKFLQIVMKIFEFYEVISHICKYEKFFPSPCISRNKGHSQTAKF